MGRGVGGNMPHDRGVFPPGVELMLPAMGTWSLEHGVLNHWTARDALYILKFFYEKT